MAFTYSQQDITNGYNALTTYSSDDKVNVFGGPARKDFYYARLVYFLIIQEKARAGNAADQAILASMPCAAVKNNNAFSFTLTYNSEEFLFGVGDIFCVRQNESEFLVQKASEQRITLDIVPLSDFFSAGKPAFFYW